MCQHLWIITLPPSWLVRKQVHTLDRDLALVRQIQLVSHHHHGEDVLVLDTQNLLLEGPYLLKALPRRDRVHQQEALARAHVLLPHRRVLLLAGGI